MFDDKRNSTRVQLKKTGPLQRIYTCATLVSSTESLNYKYRPFFLKIYRHTEYTGSHSVFVIVNSATLRMPNKVLKVVHYCHSTGESYLNYAPFLNLQKGK